MGRDHTETGSEIGSNVTMQMKQLSFFSKKKKLEKNDADEKSLFLPAPKARTCGNVNTFSDTFFKLAQPHI